MVNFQLTDEQKDMQELFRKFKHVRCGHVLVQVFSYAVVAFKNLTTVQAVIFAALKKFVTSVGKRPYHKSRLVFTALRKVGSYAYLPELFSKEQQHPAAVQSLYLPENHCFSVSNHNGPPYSSL